jgi:flagellar basal body-associated protein FliL
MEAFNNWRIICSVIVGVPLALSSIAASFWLAESPYYLVNKKQFDKAREVFRKISVYNSRPPFEFNLV